MRILMVAALALAVAGCGTGPEPPTMDGVWVLSGVGATVSMSIEDTGGTLGGDGTWAADGDNVSFNVGGTHDHPAVRIELFGGPFSTFPTLTIVGEMNGDRITGTLSGGGADDLDVTLARS